MFLVFLFLLMVFDFMLDGIRTNRSYYAAQNGPENSTTKLMREHTTSCASKQGGAQTPLAVRPYGALGAMLTGAVSGWSPGISWRASWRSTLGSLIRVAMISVGGLRGVRWVRWLLV